MARAGLPEDRITRSVMRGDAALLGGLRIEFRPFSRRPAPEIARQSQPAKFRFPDHEMEKAEPRLRAFR